MQRYPVAEAENIDGRGEMMDNFPAGRGDAARRKGENDKGLTRGVALLRWARMRGRKP